MLDRAVTVTSLALLLLFATAAGAAQSPDLAVRQITFDAGQTAVYVSNTGDADSGVFQLRVVAMSDDGGTLQSLEVDVPSIAAHQFSRVDVALDTKGAHSVHAVADSRRRVTESDESNNSKQARVPLKIGAASGSTGSGSHNKIVIPPPPPAGDIAVQQIKFGANKGKDTVTVVIRNVGDQPWKEGKRELVLTRTAMLPAGPVTTTVGKLASLPPLAPGEAFARLFPRPSPVSGATSYKWEATLAAGDANSANDRLSKTTSVTKLDDHD